MNMNDMLIIETYEAIHALVELVEIAHKKEKAHPALRGELQEAEDFLSAAKRVQHLGAGFDQQLVASIATDFHIAISELLAA